MFNDYDVVIWFGISDTRPLVDVLHVTRGLICLIVKHKRLKGPKTYAIAFLTPNPVKINPFIFVWW